MSEKLLVTSALPYANGPLHIGQIAGAYISADIYVRYKRLKGADVVTSNFSLIVITLTKVK
jgi:methionyl-tRNA synthetase